MDAEHSSPQFFVADKRLGLISLPSSSTLAIPRSEVSGSLKDFQALTYHLEELLPMDAECMSVCISGELLLATDGGVIREWWQAQTELPSTCIAIAPSALLIAQAIDRRLAAANQRSSQFCCVIASDDSLDVVRFAGDQLREWKWGARHDYDLILNVIAPLLEEQGHVVFVDDSTPPSLMEHIAGRGSTCESSTQSREELLTEIIADIQQGQVAPIANFDNGPLEFVDQLAPARSSLKALALAAALGVLLLCGALNWRAQRYRATVAAKVAEQERLFQQLFPNQSVPVGILSRMESEHRRLTAMKGDDKNTPVFESCLSVMQKFWAGMPVDARYTVELVHFTPNLLKTLDGHAKSFDDLERIRLALIEQGFEVPALSARQSSRGVSLRLDDVSLKTKSKPPKAEADKSAVTQSTNSQKVPAAQLLPFPAQHGVQP